MSTNMPQGGGKEREAPASPSVPPRVENIPSTPRRRRTVDDRVAGARISSIASGQDPRRGLDVNLPPRRQPPDEPPGEQTYAKQADSSGLTIWEEVGGRLRGIREEEHQSRPQVADRFGSEKAIVRLESGSRIPVTAAEVDGVLEAIGVPAEDPRRVDLVQTVENFWQAEADKAVNNPKANRAERIGGFLRATRRSNGQSRDAVGAELEGSAAMISGLETGTRLPTPDEIERLVDVYYSDPNGPQASKFRATIKGIRQEGIDAIIDDPDLTPEKKLGSLIREVRYSEGRSVTELALEYGIHRSQWWKIEKGEYSVDLQRMFAAMGWQEGDRRREVFS